MTTRFDEDEVISDLAAFGSLPDWLAAGMDGARVGDQIRQCAPELADGRLRLVSCTPERLRAKGGKWLARYRVTVAENGGAPRDVVLVGHLRPPSEETPAAGPHSETGARFGEVGWGCWLPETRLRLRVEPSDEGLPALPTLVEPGPAAALLQPVLHDAGYRDAVIASCRPQVVRYKPGSRCTVVVRLDYAGGPGSPPPPNPVVLKTHQGDKGREAWAAMRALWERPHTWRDVVTLAEPLAYLQAERILVQGPVPEDRTLKELAREAIADGDPARLDDLRSELTRTARALAALHRSGASYGRVATFDDELAEVREVVVRLSGSVPRLAAAAEPLLRRLSQRSHEEEAERIVPAHHDFRPAQVLLHQGDIGFIDFDGASMAEPALDLGRFRAKLRDIGISTLAQRGQPLSGEPLARNLRLLDGLCDAFLAAYQEHAPVSPLRVELWETCDLLTAMLHAWTKVRLARLEPRLAVLVHQLRRSGLADAR